jgi:tRNA-2-methylthio-N6-dimethylallyladenosine synthase
MNEHDSERMKGMLESLGYAEAPAREQADLILFNTCSIREKADSRFAAHLGEAKRVKSQRPEVIVGVGGCWAQSVKEEVFARFPFVDVAFGPGQVHKLAEFLVSDSLSAQGYFEFEGFTGHLPAKRAREHHAWVQISVGCNCVCSYCIVPSTRGREVSRFGDELVAEVEGLVADGVREVTLLGQNVNSYGRDLPREQRTTFAELLRRVDAIDGIDRIRYTSPHPKDMREDVIHAHAELPALCEHIHLPLQSGSSRVLKRMRRTYTRERYLDRVAMIREHVPDCALTTDIIVGFPGETDADFEQTLELVDAIAYDGAFTFIYSPRRGTEAASLPDQVPHELKVERLQRLVEVVQRRAHERAGRFIGRTLDVLVEGPSRTDPSRLRGRSRHNKVVNFTGLGAPGELVDVEILDATSQTLSGQESILSRALR